jgi:hypothetical protein
MKQKFKILYISGLALLLNQSTDAQTGIIIHNLTTGLDNSTNAAIPYGSTDDTWQVKHKSNLFTWNTPFVCSNLNGTWDTNTCGRWITPALDGIEPLENQLAGAYQYRTTFTNSISCFPWAKISFSFIGADNNVTGIKINGHDYVLAPPLPMTTTRLHQTL